MVEERIQNWLTSFIVGHNICPFAQRPLVRNLVKLEVAEGEEEEELTRSLLQAIQELIITPREELETTLLVVPDQLVDFDDFWSYWEWTQELLKESGAIGLLQIVGFHPDFRFADSEPEDAANFVNRSPYPLLHLLREDSISEAVDQYPDITGIPERNAVYLRRMSRATLRKLVNGRYEE